MSSDSSPQSSSECSTSPQEEEEEITGKRIGLARVNNNNHIIDSCLKLTIQFKALARYCTTHCNGL